jgi:hypothetical protein
MKWVGLIAAALVLALACRSSPPVWQRVDGSLVIPNELARDEETCRASRGGMGTQGARQRADDMKLAHEACMAERGWILEPQ